MISLRSKVCALVIASAAMASGQDMFPIKVPPGVADGQQIFDSVHVLSLDPTVRQLYDNGGGAAFDWSQPGQVQMFSDVGFSGGQIIGTDGFVHALGLESDISGSTLGYSDGIGWVSLDNSPISSPNGSHYFDNSGFHGTFIGDGSGLTGLPTVASSTIFSSMNGSVANTTTETSLAGPTYFVGSPTITSVVLKTLYHFKAWGAYSTKAAPVGNLTIRVKINADNGATIVITDLPGSVASQAYEVEGYFFFGDQFNNPGSLLKATFTTGTAGTAHLNYMATGTIVDNAASKTMDVTAQWATANSGNNINITNTLIDKLGP